MTLPLHYPPLYAQASWAAYPHSRETKDDTNLAIILWIWRTGKLHLHLAVIWRWWNPWKCHLYRARQIRKERSPAKRSKTVPTNDAFSSASESHKSISFPLFPSHETKLLPCISSAASPNAFGETCRASLGHSGGYLPVLSSYVCDCIPLTERCDEVSDITVQSQGHNRLPIRLSRRRSSAAALKVVDLRPVVHIDPVVTCRSLCDSALYLASLICK